MATSTAIASIYTMNMLGISMAVICAYFIMVFFALFVMGWALIRVIRPVYKFLEHD